MFTITVYVTYLFILFVGDRMSTRWHYLSDTNDNNKSEGG